MSLGCPSDSAWSRSEPVGKFAASLTIPHPKSITCPICIELIALPRSHLDPSPHHMSVVAPPEAPLPDPRRGASYELPRPKPVRRWRPHPSTTSRAVKPRATSVEVAAGSCPSPRPMASRWCSSGASGATAANGANGATAVSAASAASGANEASACGGAAAAGRGFLAAAAASAGRLARGRWLRLAPLRRLPRRHRGHRHRG